MLDLTGELNRFAVARATARDSVGVKECLETVLVVSGGVGTAGGRGLDTEMVVVVGSWEPS